MKYTSQILAAASGSVGGCTFSRNRSGAYVRNRSIPVNVKSTSQNVIRGALATLVARWTSTLTALQRTAWETWAVNTPQTDALGNPITVTGQNAYIMMNTLRIQAGVTVIDVAPIIFANAVLTPPSIVSATGSSDVLSISFQNTDVWAGATAGSLQVFVGRPQNPSKNFFAGPYRRAGSIQGAVTPPTSPLPITSPFDFTAAQRIHVRFRALNADGRISATWKHSIIAI